ncbi:MAG: L-glutamate gamma-semialdehyde dehydrogenase, partial [Eubacteriaceae bacterium]|nr:L-glutamate gamma-semialdehyde dehydrogenase [Eubacteriaceae bacterium]
AALDAKKEWEALSWENRLSIFLKAAKMLSTHYRSTLNAATMLSQSKTVYQAEIDSACELCDFFRFNSYFLSEIYRDQPISDNTTWNRSIYRPLEGFVLAVTPFNFTSIAGNLPAAPAMTGNTVLWKPASSSVYSSYFVMKLLMDAGLPPGVINFVPGKGTLMGELVFSNPDFAGLHYTGSTKVFKEMWKTISESLEQYKNYPRIVGETGGKDFIFAHSSANVKALVTGLIRGAFEYQGQKCSAASRAYIPSSLWEEVLTELKAVMPTIKMGDVENFTNFIGAVIDQEAFDKIKGYIDYTKKSKDAEILFGGGYDDSKGYFVEPTIIQTGDPHFKTMEEEIFGPVLTIYIYEDIDFDVALKLCDGTSGYALTGAVFAQDRTVIEYMKNALKHSAGNFYINDKPTGAIVGQQPFGGSRLSGTNDKAGSKLNLMRWISPQTVKENLMPPEDYQYPFMEEE